MLKKLIRLMCVTACVLFTAMLISGCNPKTVYSDALNFIEEIVSPKEDDQADASSEGTSANLPDDSQGAIDGGQSAESGSSKQQSSSQSSQSDSNSSNSSSSEQSQVSRPQDTTSSEEQKPEDTDGTSKESIIDGDQGPVVYF